MSEPTRYRSCVDGLEDLLASGRSGCLVSEQSPRGPRAYTMLGRIMGVVSDQDGEKILARLVRQGSVDAHRARQLQRVLQQGQAFTDVLSAELSVDEFAAVGHQQMTENLRCFLQLSGPAWFEPMSQLFFAGLRVGHSTAELLHRAQTLPAEPQVVDGVRERDDAIGRKTGNTEMALNAFADHDRDRSGGGGEFTVEKEHLDIVDLGSASSVHPSIPEVRFSSPSISSQQVEAKLRVANRVLREVIAALGEVGFIAIPSIQEFLASDNGGLSALRLDPRGEITLESVQQSLSLRNPSEHRNILERSLVELTENFLDLGADHLDDARLERLLEQVAGFHQSLRE